MPLADYQDDDDYRLLKPDEPLNLHEHRLLNRAFARLIQKHGGHPRSVVLRTVDYLHWLADRGLKNDPATRAQYVAETINAP